VSAGGLHGQPHGRIIQRERGDAEVLVPGPLAPWWVYAVSACVLGFLALNLSAEVYGPGAVGADLRYHDGRSVVVSTVPGFPTALAGLGPGDIIVSAAGHPVRTLFHWRAVLENAEVARPLLLEIERGGRREAVSLALRTTWRGWTPGNRASFGIKFTAQIVTLSLAVLIAIRRPHDRVALVGAAFLAALAVTNFVPVTTIDPHAPTLPYGAAAIWRGLPP
jgi:membrane-associated protease RseP (regulator of RpoE activity)